MKYEWEPRWRSDPWIRKVGQVLYHAENIEGALILAPEFGELPSLTRADILKDIKGDADRLYLEAREHMRLEYAARRGGMLS